MRAKKLFLSVLAFSFVSSLPAAQAQVHESATGSVRHLWGGVEFSNYNPDYNPIGGRLDGIGAYGDYYLTYRLGVEANFRFLTLNKPSGQTQKNFFGGPTVMVYQHRKFTANAKLMLGGVSINYPYYPDTTSSIGYGSYFALAPAGNVEYRLSPRLKLRGEYEFVFIPGAPGYAFTAPAPSNGLTPTGFSIGLSYRIF